MAQAQQLIVHITALARRRPTVTANAGQFSAVFTISYPAEPQPAGGWDRYEVEACRESNTTDCLPTFICGLQNNTNAGETLCPDTMGMDYYTTYKVKVS